MPTEEEMMSHFTGIGITEHDAMIIVDCIVTRKSCSWVNNDPVDDKLLRDLQDVIVKHGYRIKINVQPVPTRSKFIWEVKVLA
ncbi:MAG: hypothetical protein PHV13_05525 [Candidatus ainarchaeum sp.]|nr:hypothetical protein [Candidatus ainarchaeum sp.]